MTRKWLTFALLVAWAIPSSQTKAQNPYLISNVGAARMPDPIPYKPSKPLPPLKPGPLTSADAPPGPPPDLSLPAAHNNAYPCEEVEFKPEVFFHFGSVGLQRKRVGNLPVALIDSGNPNGLDELFPGSPFGLVNVLDASDINPNMDFGGSMTIGIIGRRHSYEFTGFYIPEASSKLDRVLPGLLNVPFINAPVGFQGNNGLFTDADFVRASIQTALGNAEFNVRYYNNGLRHLEPLIGVRYLDMQERFNILVDDDLVTFADALGQASPLRKATYSSRAVNRIIAPQIGLELHGNIFPGVAVGIYSKVGAGINFQKAVTTLVRGDGLPGLPNVQRTRRGFSGVAETGCTLDVYLTERFRVRAGYQVLYLINVLESTNQVDMNFLNGARIDNSGNVLYHGPRFEAQFLF